MEAFPLPVIRSSENLAHPAVCWFTSGTGMVREVGIARQPGFFDFGDRMKRLSDLGDRLEAFAEVVNFEMFRPELETALNYSDGATGGRLPFNPVMMLKILTIQTQHNHSDDRVELLISGRLSFMRFLGLGLHDRVPDAKTIWAFRERLRRTGAIEGLFSRFDAALSEAGYIAMSGQIVDSMLVAAPKQCNTDAEKAAIREGKPAAEIWSDEPANARQKDTNARWTVQFGKARPRKGS